MGSPAGTESACSRKPLSPPFASSEKLGLGELKPHSAISAIISAQFEHSVHVSSAQAHGGVHGSVSVQLQIRHTPGFGSRFVFGSSTVSLQ
jgi:hypothetical protein